MSFSAYFKASLKRMSRYIPGIVLLIIIFSVLAYVLFGFVLSASSDDEGALPLEFKVGLVGDLSDKNVRMGIDGVLSLDTSSKYLKILEFADEEEAKSLVEKGELVGYLLIPEDFVSSALRGDNIPAKFITKKSSVDLAPMLMSDVLNTVSKYVVESQVGVFAMEEYYKMMGLNRNKVSKEMSFNYLGYVMVREDFANVIEVGSDGKATLSCYYFAGFLVLIVLIIGIFLASFAVKKNLALSRLLYTRGSATVNQTLGEFLSFVLMPAMIILLALITVFTAGLPILKQIPEFASADMFGWVGLFVKIIPALLLVSSMQFLIYELCSNIVSATLLQFMVSVLFAYTAGCFYPNQFFPELMRKLSSFTPVDISFTYIRNVIVDSSYGLSECLPLLALSALFVALSMLVKRIKIRSNMQ